MSASVEEIAEKTAYTLSTKIVREAIDSARRGFWSERGDGELHTLRPYPMSFYPAERDPNLYYACGWGFHEHMFPWERWLLEKTIRAHLKDQQ